MAPKVTRKGSQAEGTSNPPNLENLPQVPEGEPRVDLGDQEMDAKAMRNLIATMQVEMNNLRANHDTISQNVFLQQREIERHRQEMIDQQAEVLRRQTEAATAMESTLRLAREAREAPPQQEAPLNSTTSARGERVRQRAPGPGAASRPEGPPARPAESARREERSQREEQPARSPRHNFPNEQVLPPRRRIPSEVHRQSDVHFAARQSF